MLLKNSTGLYKQTKQIELSKVMFCLIIMMMIESVLHTHTHLQSLTTKCYCKLTKGIVSYSSVYMNCYVCYCRHKTNWVVKTKIMFNNMYVIESFPPHKALQNLAKQWKESEGQTQ